MLLSIFTLSQHCDCVAQNDLLIDTQFKVLNLKKDSWNQVLDYLMSSFLNFKILIGVLFIFLLLSFLY